MSWEQTIIPSLKLPLINTPPPASPPSASNEIPDSFPREEMEVCVSEISTFKWVLITFHKNSAGCTALHILSHLCSPPRLLVVSVWKTVNLWMLPIFKGFIKQCDWQYPACCFRLTVYFWLDATMVFKGYRFCLGCIWCPFRICPP